MNILVMISNATCVTQTVVDHSNAIGAIGADGHKMVSVDPRAEVVEVSGLDLFDVVIVHYSVRQSKEVPVQMQPLWEEALEKFQGRKILYIQDEYEGTAIASRRIRRFGFDTVFTCVPEESIEAVYPQAAFPNTRFISVLTGYVTEEMEALVPRPLAERKQMISYRCTKLPPSYGRLGQQKFLLASRVREACRRDGISCDIAWERGQRVNGDKWYPFMSNARATLGTESGSNVFDWDTMLLVGCRSVERFTGDDYDWEGLYDDMNIEALEEKVCKMNQISPRVFEAAALGTAMVMVPGEYSGIVKADTHYIPIELDLSNWDEVVAKLKDDELIEVMTTQARADLIESRKYRYSILTDLLRDVLSCKSDVDSD
jgi:hypothetical protein